jgi:plastocyanin
VAALAAAASAVTVLAAGVAAPAARAADAKVAIGDYHWSTPLVNVELGQHVTWYWVGPDTMHSVTGVSPNDTGTDSDPNTNEPDHKVGFTFTVTFNVPGTYNFQCKLHPIVRGEVVVSPVPGNPDDDPEPVPKPNVDLTPPTLNDTSLRPDAFGLRGTRFHFALDQPARLDAEIWRLEPHGKRRYGGWRQWAGHIGFNEVSFADRSRHFVPRPGRYIAYVAATDASNNVSRTIRLHFTIRPPPRPRTG